MVWGFLSCFSLFLGLPGDTRAINEKQIVTAMKTEIIAFHSRIRLVIFIFLLIAAIVFLRWIDTSRINITFFLPAKGKSEVDEWAHLACPTGPQTVTPTCAAPSPSTNPTEAPAPAAAPSAASQLCPEYFRWIHEDLRPWRDTGITREMVEKARAHFRLVIVGGRAYVEKYDRSFQTRDVFTQWGILQLLRRYPGKLPDLELMFDCNDHPRIPKSPAAGPPPPALFHYCGDDSTADITFPDWSFWGWPEVNIKPWEPLSAEMKAANRHLRWADREPYAYWKGNQWVDRRRQELLQCNVSDKQDWNARLYSQDWVAESQKGFENSDLARQCKHKYKIYIEGRAWSVSRKYIQACDSPVLVVAPRYYEFFSRGMAPLRHYWPVRVDAMCAAIKFAVDWGGHHQKEAQEIGRNGSSFVFEEVKMEYVYDYMLHLLTEYARLLRFKPVVPPGAVELCREELACPVEPLAREFMRQSEVRAPAAMPPCSLPPPMKPEEVKLLWAERANATHQVELLETRPLADSEKKP